MNVFFHRIGAIGMSLCLMPLAHIVPGQPPHTTTPIAMFASQAVTPELVAGFEGRSHVKEKAVLRASVRGPSFESAIRIRTGRTPRRAGERTKQERRDLTSEEITAVIDYVLQPFMDSDDPGRAPDHIPSQRQIAADTGVNRMALGNTMEDILEILLTSAKRMKLSSLINVLEPWGYEAEELQARTIQVEADRFRKDPALRRLDSDTAWSKLAGVSRTTITTWSPDILLPGLEKIAAAEKRPHLQEAVDAKRGGIAFLINQAADSVVTAYREHLGTFTVPTTEEIGKKIASSQPFVSEHTDEILTLAIEKATASGLPALEEALIQWKALTPGQRRTIRSKRAEKSETRPPSRSYGGSAGPVSRMPAVTAGIASGQARRFYKEVAREQKKKKPVESKEEKARKKEAEKMARKAERARKKTEKEKREAENVEFLWRKNRERMERATPPAPPAPKPTKPAAPPPIAAPPPAVPEPAVAPKPLLDAREQKILEDLLRGSQGMLRRIEIGLSRYVKSNRESGLLDSFNRAKEIARPKSQSGLFDALEEALDDDLSSPVRDGIQTYLDFLGLALDFPRAFGIFLAMQRTHYIEELPDLINNTVIRAWFDRLRRDMLPAYRLSERAA